MGRLADICDGIKDTLSDATGLAAAQSYDELTEQVGDSPLLQVYPTSGEVDVGGTDRTTFGAGLRTRHYVIYADVLVRQRAHIGEDMSLLVDLVEAIEDELEKQKTGTLFGVDEIKAIHWSWTRATIDYGGVDYMGARFTIDVWHIS